MVCSKFENVFGTAVWNLLSAESSIFLIQSRAREVKSTYLGWRGNFEDYIKYYDTMRRGKNWGGTPGGGQLLEFFPRQLVVTSDNGSGSWQTVYTRPVSTLECDHVVVPHYDDILLDSPLAGLAQMSVITVIRGKSKPTIWDRYSASYVKYVLMVN